MKITKLKIRHFEGLESLDVEPSPGINLVEGKNGAGKTSILEAIRVAFTNKGHRSLLVHGGQSDGLILFELDDGTTGERHVDRGGRTAGPVDGVTQQFLNGLGLGFGFNPLEFIEMRPPEQTEKLLSVTSVDIDVADLVLLAGGPKEGIDFSEHPLNVLRQLGDAFFEDRREYRKQARESEGAVTSLRSEIPAYFDPDVAAAIDLAASVNELRDLQQAQETQNRLTRQYARACADRDRLIQEIRDVEVRMGMVTTTLSSYRSDDVIQAEISAFEVTRDNLARWRLADQHQAEGVSLRRQAADAHLALETVRAKPGELLSNTQLPVDGLGIDDDGKVIIDGLPIGELSTGEQLKVAVDIALATLGDLKVVLIDGFEGLDGVNQEIVVGKLIDAGVQAFIARIGEGELTVVSDFESDYVDDLHSETAIQDHGDNVDASVLALTAAQDPIVSGGVDLKDVPF